MAAPVEYTIGGVKIQFPCKAYPSQLAMMNSIVRGLNNDKHCLLESPTGSGKSLALLCSTLGWQQGQQLKLQQGRLSNDEKSQKDMDGGDVKKSPPCECMCHNNSNKNSPHTPVVDLTQSPCKERTADTAKEDLLPENQSLASRLSEKRLSSVQREAENDDDFQPDRKRIRMTKHKSHKKPREGKGVIFLDDESELENLTSPNHRDMSQQVDPGTSHAPTACMNEVCTKCPCSGGEEVTNKRPKIPKIFFGTRTHKQIKQIAHELKRTMYSSVPMTILSSRDHSCVNSNVAPHSNRNERCKDLREGKEGHSCRYFHNVQWMRDHYTLQHVHGLKEAWDIEELVSLGRRLGACSYYAARELMMAANIIFCPYNYLLDPFIRESMNINLDGQILVLDEAHNIEDCARESASYTLDQNLLNLCRDELEAMITAKIRPVDHELLRNFCYSLINWIQDSRGLMSERGYESASKVWNGSEAVNIFKTLGITPDTFSMLKLKLASVLEKEERVGEELLELPIITSASSTVLQRLFIVLDFLYREKCRFADDYRVVLQRNYTWTNQAPPDVPDANGFIVRRHRQRNPRVKTEVISLGFWCLNPAVAFSELSETVKSIVLTSGTLSPMGSFSSELGVKFTIQLEANHVINKSQVWVGTVGEGPKNRKLCATFQHTETFMFQDEVGELLLNVCQVVSKGVLCFLPSYKMMEKLRDRWVNTGLWDRMEDVKTVITEPRGGAKGEFDELLQCYYDAIKFSDHKDGALLIAVCRGKVSEGLDFTDDNARAVVTIGIPYPHFKDLQVELKMKYNDQHCKTRGLLSGHQWYEIQAYRALNQALGRCIRHKKDWGALVLVDDRYRNNPNKYITGLSKWVRQLVHHHDSFPNAMQSLEAFSLQQRIHADGGPAECSSVLSLGSTLSNISNTELSLLKEESRTPLSVCPVEVQRSPPHFQKHNHFNWSSDLKAAERSADGPVAKPNTRPVFPIFTSSPILTSYRKAMFKKKDTENISFSGESAPSVCCINAKQPSSSSEETQIMDQDVVISHEREVENADIGRGIVEELQAPVSSDEEDETVFFTPELFEGEEQESPVSELLGIRDDEQNLKTEMTKEEGGERMKGEGEEAQRKPRRLSGSKQKSSSASQGESEGRVGISQIQSRSSRRARGQMQTKDVPKTKQSWKITDKSKKSQEKVQQMKDKDISTVNSKIICMRKACKGKTKKHSTPKSAPCLECDTVTPTQKETENSLRINEDILDPLPESQGPREVINIKGKCKQKRRGRHTSSKRKKAKDQSPCCKGLYCALCASLLVHDGTQVTLKKEANDSKHLSLLHKFKFVSSKSTRSCVCGPQQETEKCLLVIQSSELMPELFMALQPYCEETLTGYNAIWDPSVESFTRFLQCKRCCQTKTPSVAYVHFPKGTAPDQVGLGDTGCAWGVVVTGFCLVVLTKQNQLLNYRRSREEVKEWHELDEDCVKNYATIRYRHSKVTVLSKDFKGVSVGDTHNQPAPT